MAVTGLGTEENPFIVHSYDEFISLSNHAAVENSSVYIKFFDRADQVIDCNDYGTEFKWGQFTGRADVTTFIDLNGCTIKNFMIDENCAMFYAVGYNDTYPHWHAAIIKVSNGAIRNVFASAATSKLIKGEVYFSDLSVSTDSTEVTDVFIEGISDSRRCYIDNCALYMVHNTLTNYLWRYMNLTDSDNELHIEQQNSKLLFPKCSVIGCRIQGKISGNAPTTDSATGHCCIVGYNYGSNSSPNPTNFVNNVVDLDLTDSVFAWNGASYRIYFVYNDATLNTNVFCKSHYPSRGGSGGYGYSYPTDWNYMDHEGLQSIRNGSYLNSQGFVVAEVVGG